MPTLSYDYLPLFVEYYCFPRFSFLSLPIAMLVLYVVKHALHDVEVRQRRSPHRVYSTIIVHGIGKELQMFNMGMINHTLIKTRGGGETKNNDYKIVQKTPVEFIPIDHVK